MDSPPENRSKLDVEDVALAAAIGVFAFFLYGFIVGYLVRFYRG